MRDQFFFTGSVADLDPAVNELIAREGRRQDETIILIPSESMSPDAVREAMSSAFGNIYAEGYPREESRRQTEAEIMDLEWELAYYHRYSDPRYYKGVEYADVLEALTRRRAAELFAANGLTADDLFVNVQPLSGAPANNAVYTALLEPGDTIMGLNLDDGGHLSHGSRVHRSGQLYHSVPYFVDPETELLDYEALAAQVAEVQPRLIVAGFSAYPMIVDWRRFREITDQCGAYLVADIAHISGLVASGVHPSPVGIADVVTTTTHKSLCGPRGAMIFTHRKDLRRKLDRAVFPGEQGGPHLNTMSALAVALKLAQTEQFRALQQRIVRNAARLAEQLVARGLRIVGGGSQTHLLLIDAKSIVHEGEHLSGDMAARILDLAGIVTNRNTIPGDKSAFSATGVRLGTVWISQQGYGDTEIDMLAEAIATVLHGCRPFTYMGMGGKMLRRAKVEWAALRQGRTLVRQLTGAEPTPTDSDTLTVHGPEATIFLDQALTGDIPALAAGDHQECHLIGIEQDEAVVVQWAAGNEYALRFSTARAAGEAQEWLQALSNGFVRFGDLQAKLPGPVVVQSAPAPAGLPAPTGRADQPPLTKPFFVGQGNRPDQGEPLPEFSWTEPEDAPLRKTLLHDTHLEMGGRMVPFGGWDMPVWYSSVGEEHNAVRNTAGLFDVSHMGVFEAGGPHVVSFLNTVTTNDVSNLAVGQSHYTYFLFPDGSVVDDLLIYRRGPEKFMLVVNAANNDKDWAWLTAVNEGRVLIDQNRPGARIQHPITLRDLRDPQWGTDCRVDIALQGPRSTDILLALCDDPQLAARIKGLGWARLTEGKLGNFDIIISRTGYTGERVAYELFVHPEQSPAFWQALLSAGESLDLLPCGLAARDSTRTEAGLPLYGHELAGPLQLNPADAGFGSYVKLWKPFFTGREAFIAHEKGRTQEVTRFRMDERGVRRPEQGDPVMDRRGRVVGWVTSCAIDSEGYLLGQAYLPVNMVTPGNTIYIYQTGGGSRPVRAPGEVKLGSRMPTPDSATVLTRFPSRKHV